MADDGKLSTKGMYLLHDYYKGKSSGSHPVYVLNHYSDLAVMIAIAPKDTIYGVIIKNGGLLHKTPIIAKNNQFIILDSLGVTGTIYAKPLQQELGKCLDELGIKRAAITNVDFQRQSDFVSCGTEAFLVMKEALKLGDLLFTLYQNQPVNYVPPEIAKYTQGIARLWPVCKKGVTTNLSQTVSGLKMLSIPVNKSGSHLKSETLKSYVDRHAFINGKFNLAVDSRRNKHRVILQSLLKAKDKNTLTKMAMEASGLNFLLSHPSSLQALFPYKKIDVLYEIAGITKTFNTKEGNIVIYRFSVLGDAKELQRIVKGLEETLIDLVDRYLDVDNDIKLYDLAKYVYAKYYFQQTLDKLLLKQSSQSDSLESTALSLHSMFPPASVGKEPSRPTSEAIFHH
ncbi:hypothetical protein [Legionella spiritensis]|uniref:Uncharacterized protein n=2 Tax=Legionella spiritensis TaxID=452 RepID=A0A0W0YXI1_LEGSP|nr:hypothetical protein [Legionella spiritensis]KTD61588.1 hypothetical protein Lspi_2218 [Legionella spiritensis]SNV32301.1 Uncharacterised protein [Legionella spiritensis]